MWYNCRLTADTIFLDGQGLLKKYSCPRCEHILKDAVQLSCGHWLCQSCADLVFKDVKGRCAQQ